MRQSVKVLNNKNNFNYYDHLVISKNEMGIDKIKDFNYFLVLKERDKSWSDCSNLSPCNSRCNILPCFYCKDIWLFFCLSKRIEGETSVTNT